MKKYLFIVLLLPLILSGCFFNKKNQEPAVQEPDTQTYRSQNFEDFYFFAKYPNGWETEEGSNGLLDASKNQISFAGRSTQGIFEQIMVEVAKIADRQKLLQNYKIETQTQTEISGALAVSLNGSLTDDESGRFEAVLAESGAYLILVKTNYPASQAFTDFKDNLSFPKLTLPAQKPKSDKIVLSLYFDKLNAAGQDFDCSAKAVKKVTVLRPEQELGLIPLVVKLLLQLSVPEELSQENLSSALDLNTRLYSFGYENSKAIVNFDSSLNEGGGSCLMAMRRSQIEQTLKALNSVSNLQIRQVEIQVAGESDSALQP